MATASKKTRLLTHQAAGRKGLARPAAGLGRPAATKPLPKPKSSCAEGKKEAKNESKEKGSAALKDSPTAASQVLTYAYAEVC